MESSTMAKLTIGTPGDDLLSDDTDNGTEASDSEASSDGAAVDVDEKITSVPTDSDTTPMLDFRTPTEWFSFVAGICILSLAGPPVGLVTLTAMIWEAMDRGFDGGFVDSGRELTGFIFSTLLPWIERVSHRFNERFVKRSEDAYMMNCIYFYGLLIPILFCGCALIALQREAKMSPLWVAFIYHVFRIGPYFMNFAYVYTLCHKEGHSYSGLFAKNYNDSIVLRNVFNWWVAMFYGVLPASFAYGHAINHHRYNNGPLDVVTTSDKPRDNFCNWVAYLPRWFLYAINISTMHQFICERNWKVSLKVFLGSTYFFVWYGFIAAAVSPTFAFVFVAFPFLEAGLLLGAVNWSWHAFLDPNDPANEYVQSVTILDGCINVLNEDSHVIHHKVPGAHWTDHPRHQQKLWAEYVESRASCFRRTHAFEIFGMVVIRDYDALAKKWVDLKGDRDGNPISHDERVCLLKERLRGCWWGPRAVTKITSSPPEAITDLANKKDK